MASRLDLHERLCTLLGSRNVYFQPPESIKLKYDCIVYKEEPCRKLHADDKKYLHRNRYTLTYITKDPDSPLIHVFDTALPYCNFDQSYTSDNLNHYVYNLYY